MVRLSRGRWVKVGYVGGFLGFVEGFRVSGVKLLVNFVGLLEGF